TVRALDWRPAATGLVYLATAITLAIVELRWPAHLVRRLFIGTAPLPILLLVSVTQLGGNDGVRKAATLYSAFGGPLIGAARSLVDFDRDGYSPILGGGDCNDFDPAMHPGAFDVPDNGRDENCSGADATRKIDPPAPFHAVPTAVPESLNVLLITIDT